MLKLKNWYRWCYDQNKQNFCFRKVAHLAFTLYGDFWLSHNGDCVDSFAVSHQKCDYEINNSAPSVRFKIKFINGLTFELSKKIFQKNKFVLTLLFVRG